jgi:parvulin-like peptidyl-prolyl isomerase
MFRFIVLLIVLLGLVLINGCGLSDDTVAKVGGSKITVDEFKFQLGKRYPGKGTFTNVDSVTKISMINRLVNIKMKVNAALELGLDNEAAFKTELKNQSSRMIGQKYFERVIVDKLISEKELRVEFDRRKEEVRASHILISFQGGRGGASNRTKEEAIKLALEVKSEVEKGMPFDKLAEKYSEDPSAKQNHGDLGYFAWGKMVGEFQNAAFALSPGQVSDPVETAYGYHIIKIADRRISPEYNPENFEAQKLELKRSLYQAHQDTAMKMWKAIEAKLKKDNSLLIMNDNVEKVVTLAKEKQVKNLVKPEDYTDEEKNIVLAKWDGGKVTLKGFIDLYLNHFDAFRRRLADKNSFQKDVENTAFTELIAKDADRIGLFDEKDVKLELQEFSDQRLASEVEKKEVTDKAQPADDEIKKYYEEHKSEYLNPAEIEIWEVFVKNEKLAGKILGWAKTGKKIEDLAAKYSEDATAKKKNGYMGFKAEKRYGDISKEAFKAGENKVIGPIKNRNGFSVVKTGKLKPEMQRSYEEASSQVKSKVRSTKLTERRKTWEEELKNGNKVTIYTKLLKNI